jgi:hypothetical protein
MNPRLALLLHLIFLVILIRPPHVEEELRRIERLFERLGERRRLVRVLRCKDVLGGRRRTVRQVPLPQLGVLDFARLTERTLADANDRLPVGTAARTRTCASTSAAS